MTDFTIRRLPPSEWDKIIPGYRMMELDMPDPRMSQVYLAETLKGREPAGFLVAQRLLHAEPVFTYPQFRNLRVGWALYDHLDSIMPSPSEYYVTMQNEGLIAQAYKRGFVEIPGKVMAKTIGY